MEVKRIELNYALIKLNVDELVILNNALNEVCNVLDIPEFYTRIGAQLQEASSLSERKLVTSFMKVFRIKTE